MSGEAIHRLLLECGFRNALWAPPLGQHWSVVGELDGGFEVSVRCVSGARGGVVLLVPSESVRQWLLEVLAQNGAGPVDVRSEQMEPELHRRSALPAGLAAVAMALMHVGLSLR
jgi:hypothetical protein